MKKKPKHLRFKSGTTGGRRANGLPPKPPAAPPDRVPPAGPPAPLPAGADPAKEAEADAKDAAAVVRLLRTVLAKK